jgi:dolichyl-phosphate-mannose-protein mannosyltransferase
VRPLSKTPVAAALVLLAVFAAARGSLHAVTFALPVSNDDAILLLMARHVLRGELATTLWNQPYNGALDAYLLAPGLALGPHHLVYRLYEIVCALLLVVLTGLLARRIAGTTAGLAAAALAAFGTPYMGLMTATGPPPNFLMPLVTGFPLLVGLRALDSDAPPAGTGLRFGLGVVCGLAVWNSSLAIPAFAGMAAGLVVAGLRPGRALLPFLVGFVLGASPLLVARVVGASGASVVTAASAVTAIRPRWLWASGLRGLAHALVGLTGLEVPLVVDGLERAALPLAASLALAAGLVGTVTKGALSRRALPLVGWGAALAGAFALSRRTGPDDLRYLYGVHAPMLALAGVGLARAWAFRRGVAVLAGLAIVGPWGLGYSRLVDAWRDPTHAVRVWQVPPIDPPVAALEVAGVRSAYASLQFAGRIGLESEGALIASQAWNERIPGDPLRFRDEVDLDPRPAWVLHPALSRGMPRATRFGELVREAGGAVTEERAGDFVIFRDFVPPYDEARPVPVASLAVSTLEGEALPAAVLDRDPATAWTSHDGIGKGSGLAVRVTPARRLSALVLAVDLVRTPLGVPWIASIDGQVVRTGPVRHVLQWLGGALRAGRQALLAIPLDGRTAGEVRLVFQGPGPPLGVSEVFAYGPDEAERPALGAAAARDAYEAVRRGAWTEAARLYAEAVRAEPDRAAYHAALARAGWRMGRRRVLDVEGIDDGGPDLVLSR